MVSFVSVGIENKIYLEQARAPINELVVIVKKTPNKLKTTIKVARYEKNHFIHAHIA